MTQDQQKQIAHLLRTRFVSKALRKIAMRSDLTADQADLAIQAMKQAPLTVRDKTAK